MRIVSLEDNNIISLSKDIQYSFNGDDWNELSAYNEITVNSDDIVYFKGTELQNRFTVNKAFNVEGNIMSLLYGDDFEGQIDLTGKYYAFYMLFSSCKRLKNAQNLILPATTLVNHCYYCMFGGCSSLTSAPQLPATTLKHSCYYQMFHNCTGLTTAPELPATTLEGGCYEFMFQGCSNLNKIVMLATDISASRTCLNNWVDGVASTGTFVKHTDMTSLPTGDSGIPEGWSVEDYNG